VPSRSYAVTDAILRHNQYTYGDDKARFWDKVDKNGPLERAVVAAGGMLMEIVLDSVS